MKTVRFSQVIAAAGRPRAHTLWVPPERDPEFKRARTANRVMTIAHTAGKTDAGIVGFDAKQGASEFLIFPKSLKKFEGARVVGVKFDLVEQPKLGAAKPGAWKTAPAHPSARARKAKPAKLIPFPPSEKTPPPKPARKPEAERQTKAEAKPPEAMHLVREIRAALKELEAGKSVAAYRRLEKAIV